MEATELRIGNLIYFKDVRNYKREVSVKVIDIDQIMVKDSDWLVLGDFEGIPLTEEWLEKFGFDKGKRFAGYTKWRHPSGFIVMINDIGKEFKITTQGVLSRIEYVHTLQNCFYYFALTGEELKEKKLKQVVAE